MKVVELKQKERWRVFFNEGLWQAGLYRPEHENIKEIDVLEKHDAPELFYLIRGNIVLVIGENGKIHEVGMEAEKAYIIEEWHNAYRPEGAEGLALVIERTNIRTEFKPISEFQR